MCFSLAESMIDDLLVLDNQVNPDRTTCHYNKIHDIETNTDKSVKFFKYFE